MITIDYSDIDFSFTHNPLSNDIALKTNDEAIKQAVKNLILTDFNERPFQSYIGSQVRNALFDLNIMGDMVIKKTIINCINNFEPRVELTNIKMTQNSDEHSIFITLYLNIKNTERKISMGLTLEKTR